MSKMNADNGHNVATVSELCVHMYDVRMYEDEHTMTENENDEMRTPRAIIFVHTF